ncbi:MAG: SGNH/GDSL hydrolase family protein, partial [Candidatus Binatia bacterium]
SLVSSRSGEPIILDRYSLKFALLLGGVLLSLLLFGTLIVINRRRMPQFFTSLLAGPARIPGLLESVVISGSLSIILLPFGSVFVPLLSGLWFMGGVVITYMGAALLIHSSLSQSRAALLRKRALFVLLGLVLSTFLFEAGLRIVSRFTPYRILPANLRWEFHPIPAVMPGVGGVSRYSTNRDGIRGDPYHPDGRYNLLAVGGSTTECIYLDDSEAWPYLLQVNLNQRNRRLPVWVGNVGRSGYGLVEHIHALRHFVPQFRIDAVVVMVGINDLTPALRHPEKYNVRYSEPNYFRRFEDTFYTRPLVDANIPRPFPENLALWNLVDQALLKEPRRIQDGEIRVEDQAGLNYVRRRQLFHNAPKLIQQVPDLSAALDQYERNLVRLITTAAEQGIHLILTTQPVAWSDHISGEAESLLWMGLYGDKESPMGRYSVKALAVAMNLFNQRLLAVCKHYKVMCVDLAGNMRGNERYFYDDAHFNELGSSKVAEILAAILESAGILEVR